MQCRDTHKLKGPIYTILTFSSHTYVTLPFGRDLPINHNTSLPTKWYYLSIFLQDITKGGYHFLFFDDKLTSGNNSMEEVTKGGRRREWYAKWWWWWVQNHYKQSLVDHIFQTGYSSTKCRRGSRLGWGSSSILDYEPWGSKVFEVRFYLFWLVSGQKSSTLSFFWRASWSCNARVQIRSWMVYESEIFFLLI